MAGVGFKNLKFYLFDSYVFRNRILTLAPHFRLMRLVESHMHEGDLTNIDALLGCSLQLPSPTTLDKFHNLSEREKFISLTCLFYAINWLTELINAFSTQKDAEYKRKASDVFNYSSLFSFISYLLRYTIDCDNL